MTRTVPVRRLISLMTFALGLSIALPSHAVTVSEAVTAARNTQLPDIDGIMANHDGVLDAVGGGSTAGLDDVKNRLDMSAVEDMLQSKVFCPDELALISFHLRLDTAFMMEAHAALTLPSCSKPSTVVAEPADTLKECVVKHGYKTLNHFSEVHGFDPIAMNTISLHRRCTDSTGMKLAKALNVSLEEIRTVLVASDFDPVPKSLKLLIKKRNYTTYKEFAAAAGLTEHHIMKIAKTRTCTTTCAVKLCKALGITEDELAASLLIAEPRHKHGSKLETPSKESMEEVASTKARRKKDESDTEEECGTSTVSLKRPRRSSK